MPEPISSPTFAAHLDELARTAELLVALDFDGTLAPLVDDPEQSRALPQAHDAIVRLLELPRTRVALISGRAMGSLSRVTMLPETTLLIASHGVESRLDAAASVTLTDAELQARTTLHHLLLEIADATPGAWVEEKPAGFALHVRQAEPDAGRRAVTEAERRVTEHLSSATMRHGANVIEFSVRADTKGDGLRLLLEFTGATAVLFAGDDVTDEDGFAALAPADIGLKCGPGETLAGYRADDPSAVAAVLQELADIRQAATAGG